MKNVLIVVDMQRDFIDGALGTAEALAILPEVEKYIQGFEGDIIFTRDTHEENYLTTSEGIHLPVPHCIRGTEGHEIHPILLPYAKCVIDKPTFGSRELCSLMLNMSSDISSVTLIGVCTDICVISNALMIKATLPETKISVIGDLCAGVTPESHRRALDAMKMCQIEIK